MNVDFAFGNQLNAKLEKMIIQAKESLILISPFIDLDPRIVDVLRQKKQSNDFHLRVLFGKNQLEKGKSVKQESLVFLKSFDTVEIRYNARLHAKFYMNDYEFLISSMNLYNYSLANNIEVGVIGQHKQKNILQSLWNKPNELLSNGLNYLKSEAVGLDREVNPIEEFSKIYNSSEALFQKIKGKTTIDGTSGIYNAAPLKPMNATVGLTKLISASKLSAQYGITINEVNRIVSEQGLVTNSVITAKGKALGLENRVYMGNPYIAYPENLIEQLNANK